MGRRSKGFTLPEVLVALAVLAVLLAILLPGVGGALRSRQAADAPKKVAALIRTASAMAASQEVYVEVVHDPTRGRVYLRRSEASSGPFLDLGPAFQVSLPPGTAVAPSGFPLRFNPAGLLEASSYPVKVTVGSRTLSVSRWGDVE